MTYVLNEPFMAASLSIAPGGGDSHMKQTGMLVVSLRGENFGFWSRLGYSGQRVPRRNVELREEKQKSNFVLNFHFR